ncbi:MAG: glycine zipper 2TM domain-containing protein [Rhodospirillales bacterium]|nr:glycine zipper 2TM domain-containing protein [Rhodospirillales bacterium]
MRFTRLTTVFVLVGFLAACADAQNAPKQTIGTLLGAGAGALLGSKVGGGKGRLAAVAIGALGGAWLGSEVGKSMDDVDRMKANQTQNAALETNRDGAASTWSNPNNGHRGSVTPIRTYESAGQNCREYQHQVTIGGNSETVVGTACRQPDGTWRVNESARAPS